MNIIEGLESFPSNTDQWKSYLRQLYLLSMGNYLREGEKVEPKEAPSPASAEKVKPAAEPEEQNTPPPSSTDEAEEPNTAEKVTEKDQEEEDKKADEEKSAAAATEEKEKIPELTEEERD